MNKIGFTPPVPEVVPRQLSEGEKPYILTRLEYLAIKLNVWWGSSTKIDGINLFFEVNPQENTIIIQVYCLSSEITRDVIDNQIKLAENILLAHITPIGWDDWVKIEINEVP